MNQSITRENSYQSRVWAGNIRLAGWNAAWAASCVLMTFGPRFLWNKALVFTLLAVGLNLCVGVGMVLATKKYIMQLDELQQKVYLNALGITVGVALIVSIPYSVMDRFHMIPFHADISHLWVLMTLTFIVSFVRGMLRYR